MSEVLPPERKRAADRPLDRLDLAALAEAHGDE
jgi:hypothetical protein